MIGRPPRPKRHNPVKAQHPKIKLIDKDIDHTNRIVFAHPVLKPFREQRRLAAINALDETLHPITPNHTMEESYQTSRFTIRVFTQSGSKPEVNGAPP